MLRTLARLTAWGLRNVPASFWIPLLVLFPITSFVSYLAFWIPLGALIKAVLPFDALRDQPNALDRYLELVKSVSEWTTETFGPVSVVIDLAIFTVIGIAMVVTFAVVVGVPFVVGAVLAYNIATVFYRTIRRPIHLHSISVSHASIQVSDAQAPEGHNPLAPYRTIGIILAGGGAKGAYQAGALTALDEFLRAHGALDRVKVIAGTSIGAWNALFWLGGLVHAPERPAALEAWWSQIRLRNVVDPAVLWPARQNYMLSNAPWQSWFEHLFRRGASAERLTAHVKNAHAKDSIHFYFTRSNVRRASLEVVTNCIESHAHGRPPVRARGAESRIVTSLDELGRAVFSSMDFPPAFPYFQDDGDWFEDGGVIDNLPIRFATQVYACDLLFVFPLNASFAAEVNDRSMIRRLLRVMAVRQGALERDAFRELQRTEQPPTVVAVCPAPPLLIDTVEFWRRTEAARAFSLMYKATLAELGRFDFSNPPWPRLTLVSQHGEITYLEDV